MYSIKNKMMAILLVTVIAVGNFTTIGRGISISYASNSNLENQSIATNNENVEFDAYFLSKNNKVHTLTQNIAEKTTLYIDVQVKKTGYLKEANI